jgi:hypothetical protein
MGAPMVRQRAIAILDIQQGAKSRKMRTVCVSSLQSAHGVPIIIAYDDLKTDPLNPAASGQDSTETINKNNTPI